MNKVILLSSQTFCMRSHKLDYPATRSMHPLGLVMIRDALKSHGHDKVTLFPANPETAFDLNEDYRSIADDFMRLGADEPGTTFGLSTYSDDYFKFVALTGLIRREFPKAQIVAGGPHFNWEKIGDQPNTVEDALGKGLADAVQVGHAQAFVDLITKHNGKLDLAEGSGLYRRDAATGKLIGTGFGQLPEADRVPYAFQESRGHLRSLWDDGCRNLCDYCVIPRSRSRMFPVERVVRSLKPALKEHQPRYFTLLDSNPFDPGRYDYYEQLLSDLFQGINPVLKFSYLNPSHLTISGYMSQLGRLFTRNHFWGFYVGRDSVTETNAADIGKKFHGQLKNQKQLDDEKAALLSFINALQILHAQFPKLPPRKLTLYYIVSPFESRESALAIVDDMENFLSRADGGVKIDTQFFPLTPFPGTRIRKQLHDRIELTNYNFSSLGISEGQPWKQEIGPAVKLLSRLAEIRARKPFADYLGYFRQVINQVFE